MGSTHYLQECAETLKKNKPAWKLLNSKAVAHIYMAVSEEVLGNIWGLTSVHEVWSKLAVMRYVQVNL